MHTLLTAIGIAVAAVVLLNVALIVMWALKLLRHDRILNEIRAETDEESVR